MRHDFLDRYSRLQSPIHRLPAGLKLISALLLVLATVMMPQGSLWFYILATLGLLVLAAMSTIPPRFILGRLLMLEPVVLGFSIFSIFRSDGWSIFLTLLTKGTLSILTMIILANTTPFAKILELLRSARVPGLLVTVLALLYRYLFLLIDEGERMHRARQSRTFVAKNSQRYRTIATVVSQLFVRSTERADRIYAAMRARGWQ